MDTRPRYFRYWGKADSNYDGEPKWHPVEYHCLDVAAVAATWWDANPVMRRVFLAAFDWPEKSSNRLRTWVLFFVALHDLGKFDVRFQIEGPGSDQVGFAETGLGRRGRKPCP